MGPDREGEVGNTVESRKTANTYSRTSQKL